jgi:integrase/recombinase XerD
VHTIRHAFATHLVDSGTDLHTVKELLGHSSIQTTMQYLHLTQKRTAGIINPYDALMQDKTATKEACSKGRKKQ